MENWFSEDSGISFLKKISIVDFGKWKKKTDAVCMWTGGEVVFKREGERKKKEKKGFVAPKTGGGARTMEEERRTTW